jgi:5-methylcytosine-specific restriction endonuclease McrA
MCGDRATEVDHIIELARGGTNTIDNVQPLVQTVSQAQDLTI